jgi:sigma-E factor negative regulatory protein RseA
MKQRVSDLMDGEVHDCDDAQLDAAWRALAKDDELRESWSTYHLIGECLRGQAKTPSESCTQKIFARLAEEPTILSPQRVKGDGVVGGKARIALAMAASVATLGVVGVIATRQPAMIEVPAQIAQQPGVQVQQVANGAPQVNDYLALHRQFANAGGIQQATLVRDGKAQRPVNSK